jgi:malonyl-CoA decarboxylase
LEHSLHLNSRLFNLVPFAKYHNETETALLTKLNNSTEASTILNEIRDVNMENLIKIRETSMKLALKNLSSLAFGLLNESFALKNLEFKRISWDDTKTEIAEFIRINDRVRPVNDLKELKKRLVEDFRCYGVFHEALNMPVSFVFIRLYKGLASNLLNLLNDTIQTKSDHDSCVFYSISSPMKGLNGIEFGTKLIKNVTSTIQNEMPQIKIFATFSPITGFRAWLEKNSAKYRHLTELKTAQQVAEHELELMLACAEYLDKRGTEDSVARFHYRNGASLGPIRFAADPSPSSFKQSYGIQVNYIYYQ